MQKNIVAAQAATLIEWAEQWERDALMPNAAGYVEVAALLRRSARQMTRVAKGEATEQLEHTEPPRPIEIVEVRADQA